MAENGYIKLFRQIDEWRFWDRPYYTQVWMHILVKVNWKEKAYKYGVEIGPGETIITLRGFAEECGISKTTLSRILTDLEAEGQLETRIVTAGHNKTFIKVHNYAVFQESDGRPRDRKWDAKEDTKWDDKVDTPSLYRRNKEHKNIRKKSVEAEPPTSAQISDYIREINGKTDPDRFFEYYQARGWKNITDWKAAVRSWEAGEKDKRRRAPAGKKVHELPEYMKDTWDD